MASYSVANPFFVRLGIGPMSDEDIAVLEEDFKNLFEVTYLKMSPESQLDFEDFKEECATLVAEAKMKREVETYTAAAKCITDTRTVILDIIDIEEKNKKEPCPPGTLKVEDNCVPIKPTTVESQPTGQLPPPPQKEEGLSSMSWVLIGGAGILLVAAVTTALTR